MNTRAEISSSRLAWRLLILLWAVLMVGTTGAKADPAKTLVQDTLYRADGSVARGNITIRWDGFSSVEGEAVPAGEKSWATDNNGVIAIPLIPNVGSTPAGGYYKVVIKLDDGTTSEERWVVPAAASTTVSAIRAQVVSQSVAAQFVHMAGAESIQGRKNFLTSPEVPDPTDAGGVANKEYVDQQLQGLATVASTGNYDDLANKPVGSVGGAYLPLAGGSLTGPLSGSIGTFSGTVAAGTTVSANDSITKNTPLADIRSYGAKCDGVTDDTEALQAAITSVRSTGGKIGTFGNCYFANPAGLTWGNNAVIQLVAQGQWLVGNTFIVNSNVHLTGDGGAPGVMHFLPYGPFFSINGKSLITGTLGTTFAAGTAVFTPSSMTGIVPGTAISIAAEQTCTITSITRASNKVTATLSGSCRTPAGANLAIAGVTDSSFNGSFVSLQADYVKNTIAWSQMAADGSSGSGTLMGLNEDSLETVAVTATTGTTATAVFIRAHNSTDQFGIVTVEMAGMQDKSMTNVQVGSLGGTNLWLNEAVFTGLINVGSECGQSTTITCVPLEISTSWWLTIERGAFTPNTGAVRTQPWGVHMDEIDTYNPGNSTGALSITDTTIVGGIKVDASGYPGRAKLATGITLRKVILEMPSTAVLTIDPRNSVSVGNVYFDDVWPQDNFSGYVPSMIYYTDYSGGKGGIDLKQIDNTVGTNLTGGYYDGSLIVRSAVGNFNLPALGVSPVGTWTDGKTTETELRGEGASMSPQLIPFATKAIPNPTEWASSVSSGHCSVIQGVLAPDGSTTAVGLSPAVNGTAGQNEVANISMTTNTGDWFIYGAWVKPDNGALYAVARNAPFYLHSYGASDVFLNTAGNEAMPTTFQTMIKGDWWTPVVGIAQLKVGDGGLHGYGFEAGCGYNASQALDMWGPFLIQIPASAGVSVQEVERWRQQLLHGYVPPSMPSGGQILAMHPSHKLYWGNDTNLYRSAAGVVKTDGAFDAATGYKCNGSLGTSGQVLGTNGTACQWVTVTPGTGSVSGPVSSTVGNIATFNSTDGKVLKDIGIQAAGFSTPVVLDFKTTSAPTGATGSNPWTYMLPANAHVLEVVIASGGAGGGSGGVASAGGNTFGGGGGSGGCVDVYTIPASYFGGAGASLTVLVGAGGAGGVVVSGSGAAVTGNGGASGGQSNLSGPNGVFMSASYNGSGSNGGAGGATGAAIGGTVTQMCNYNGSAGGAGSLTAGASAQDINAPKGGAGGAGGGGISSSGTVASAGGGQLNPSVQSYRMPVAANTSGAVAPGGAGQTPTISTSEPMVFGALGGTGGASSVSTNGGAGGAGMFPAGGGAGGGAAMPGFSSGAGGKGGDGMVRIIVQ